MNNMKSSSILKFSFYHYSCAIELEYSFHVIILTYELVYSLYVMILTCCSYDIIIAYELDYSSYVMISSYRTLCLIIHAIYVMEFRWRFVVPPGLPIF
jgi:hypothetical protein